MLLPAPVPCRCRLRDSGIRWRIDDFEIFVIEVNQSLNKRFNNHFSVYVTFSAYCVGQKFSFFSYPVRTFIILDVTEWLAYRMNVNVDK